ncbi:hypothetical protein P280DRAFT_536696 [Massarina eburnea CBS 473.64]|uniref:Uncharacterized protein n=1 Tax=Massarina eburnea CBS 473.64 TaxID=1395130 RepID=A0A6A6RIN6_9PLEO|nr:hypothetical protein P280DRAFT_536696 [Massarina eburnea CBS 473.64]
MRIDGYEVDMNMDDVSDFDDSTPDLFDDVNNKSVPQPAGVECDICLKLEKEMGEILAQTPVDEFARVTLRSRLTEHYAAHDGHEAQVVATKTSVQAQWNKAKSHRVSNQVQARKQDAKMLDSCDSNVHDNQEEMQSFFDFDKYANKSDKTGK